METISAASSTTTAEAKLDDWYDVLKVEGFKGESLSSVVNKGLVMNLELMPGSQWVYVPFISVLMD